MSLSLSRMARAALALPRLSAVAASRRFTSDLMFDRLRVETIPTSKPKLEDKTKLGFGKYFSDHMLMVKWTESNGWDDPRIIPFGDITLSPASSVFHYGLECFEGLKAFRGVDDKIRLFCPDRNINRLHKSCDRLALPLFSKDDLYKCIVALIQKDASWIPSGRGYALYVRPTVIATHPSLGVAKTSSALMYVLLSPVGSYWGDHGFKPVKLYADPVNVRAWPGGMGEAKCGGNYAGTIKPQAEALAREGCQQVLWLFGPDHNVTEVGTMNLFMLWINDQGEKELITAPLDGTILEGVTRYAVLELARTWNDFKVTEGYFNMKQIKQAAKENRILEMFGAGTAATVSPVAAVKYQGDWIKVPPNGRVAERAMKEIFDIQYGVVPHAWAPVIA